MKKGRLVVLSFLLFFGSTPLTRAQDIIVNDYNRVGLGIRYMPTISSLDVQKSDGDIVRTQFVLGYGLGGLIEANFTKHMGVNAEVIYSTLNQKYKDQGLEREIEIKYVNVPVMFSLNTSKARRLNLNLSGGPQAGINVGSRMRADVGSGPDTVNAVLALKAGDLGLAYGAGLEFSNMKKTLRFDIGFRGVFGLINVADTKEEPESRTYYAVKRSNIETYAAYFGVTLLF